MPDQLYIQDFMQLDYTCLPECTGHTRILIEHKFPWYDIQSMTSSTMQTVFWVSEQFAKWKFKVLMTADGWNTVIIRKCLSNTSAFCKQFKNILQSVYARQIAMEDASVIVLVCHVQLCVVAHARTDNYKSRIYVKFDTSIHYIHHNIIETKLISTLKCKNNLKKQFP